MTTVLTPKSYRGTDISLTASLVRAAFPTDGTGLVPGQYDQRFVPVAGRHPYPLAPQPFQKELTLDVVLNIALDGTAGGDIATFLGLFDGALGEQALIATDGTTDWQVDASVLRLTHANGVLNHWTVTLQATDPIWRKTTDSTDTNSAGAVTTLAIAATALGNQRAPLIVEATPTVVKGAANDKIHGRQVVIAWRAPSAGLNYPVAIQMDTATEVTATRMQADGDDIEVQVDNVTVQRDLGSMNAATTNIWFVADWAPARSATIKTAMTAGSPATNADWNLGPTADTSDLPDSGVVLIGTEAIHYTSKSSDGHTLETVTRGVRNTTAASHGAEDVAYYVEHDIQVVYGHTAATAPTPDADRTPMFNRAATASSNSQWTYDSTYGFATEDGRRPAEWTPMKFGTNARMVTVRGQKTSATFVPLANGTLTTGWTANTGTLFGAVDDPVGTPDDNTTYISASANTQYATFGPQTGGVLTGIPDDALIASVAVTIRAENTVSGGSSVVAVLYMPNEDLNPAPQAAHALTTSVYNEFTDTWTENIWSGLPWTSNDLKNLQFGVGSSGIGSGAVIRVTQVYLTVTYAPHADPGLALGIYADSGEYQPGFPNRDAWKLETPVGVLGSGGAVATIMPGGVVNDNQLYGTDAFGQFQSIGRSFSGGGVARHIRARPDVPLFNILWHAPTATTTTWAGAAMTDMVLQFDPASTPSVVVGARQDVYVHRWTLTQDDDAGNAIAVQFVSPLSQKLTVDADTGTVTFALAGRLGLSALSLNTQRLRWLDLIGGQANDLTWADASNGSGVTTVNLRWRDRRI